MSSGKKENGWLKSIGYKWLFARQLTGRRGRIIAIVLALMLAGAGAAIPIGNWVLGPLSFERANDLSTIVLDRNGLLLRAFTTAKSQRWRLPVRLDEVDPLYIRLLLSYEDKRFYSHHGIDLIATMRAIRQLIASRRVVSGASTLTMQVARLLEPRDNRNLKAKIRQALRALELERRFSKRQILELYLRLAPFGGNIEGVRAASLAYFGHEPLHLSLAEAALLVALPQSPEMRRPDRHPQAARRARDRVLMRAARAGAISLARARLAMREQAPHARRPFPKHAPHLARSMASAHPGQHVLRLTIERSLQKRLQAIARRHAARLGPRHSVAIMAIDNQSGEVLAHIGSPDFLDDRLHGPIDMTRAIRSPGSALKPFVYGLAFEDGIARPLTLISDEPTRFGNYAPQNFDHKWRGEVTIAKALQLSLNVPAVKLLDKVGPARLLARLRQCGIEILSPPGTRPNLSMILGGLGITMRDLARAYVALARGGKTIDLRWMMAAGGRGHKDGKGSQNNNQPSGQRLLDRRAAWQIARILTGSPPPANALPDRIAYKTGTSYGYHDAWAAGFDGKTTIIVWAGRPDGASSPGLTGRSAAAPILFDAFAALGRPFEPLPPAPPNLEIASTTASLPPALRHFEPEPAPSGQAKGLYPPVKIAFPPNGSRLELGYEGKNGKREFSPLAIKTEGGKPPLTWMVNGAPVSKPERRHDFVWKPNEPGFVRISVLDALGRADSVFIRIK